MKWRDLIDQPLHMLWAGFALWPLLFWCEPWTFALSGFLIDVPREFWDQRPEKWTWKIGFGKTLDLSFFALGGYILGVFA